jgi:hypothetical protein
MLYNTHCTLYGSTGDDHATVCFRQVAASAPSSEPESVLCTVLV